MQFGVYPLKIPCLSIAIIRFGFTVLQGIHSRRSFILQLSTYPLHRVDNISCLWSCGNCRLSLGMLCRADFGCNEACKGIQGWVVKCGCGWKLNPKLARDGVSQLNRSDRVQPRLYLCREICRLTMLYINFKQKAKAEMLGQ